MGNVKYLQLLFQSIDTIYMDSQKPPQKQQNPNQQMQPQQDDDDLDDLGLFHKSSLKNKQQCPLPEHVPETYSTKRTQQPTESKIGKYTQYSKLGSGAFAQVIKVSHNGQFYAMKIYSLLKLKSRKFYAADGSFADSEEMFRNQVEIIKRVRHGNLAKCVEILYGGNYAYVVMELCDLGQIMNWSEQKNNFIRNPKVIQYLSTKYKLTTIQDLTRLIFLQAALGLQYLHHNNISNRDIKVDNLLCRTVSPQQPQGQEIKIADFTTARYSHDDISYFTCGTAGFRCPEMLNAGADGYSCKALDIWALGISMYTYYYEGFPFMDETEYLIEVRAEKEELKYGENCPTWLRNVLKGMTQKNWKERIGIDEVVKLLSTGGEV